MVEKRSVVVQQFSANSFYLQITDSKMQFSLKLWWSYQWQLFVTTTRYRERKFDRAPILTVETETKGSHPATGIRGKVAECDQFPLSAIVIISSGCWYLPCLSWLKVLSCTALTVKQGIVPSPEVERFWTNITQRSSQDSKYNYWWCMTNPLC